MFLRTRRPRATKSCSVVQMHMLSLYVIFFVSYFDLEWP